MTVRYALRRVLWIVPTLVVVSMVAFWAVSSSVGREPSQRQSREDHARLQALPRYFNPNPLDASERARALVDAIDRGGADAEQARSELGRLGGAILPHVLPRLDALRPTTRAQVALALAPVAHRMQVGGSADLDDPDQAVVFWTRFWQDRSIDFRPVVARRAVRRLAERSSTLRRADIVQLDTYALGELVRHMGDVSSSGDVERARRLAELASHATGRGWTIPKGASPAQARAVVARWQRWWSLHRADYVTFDGLGRVGAMISETQYGKWAASAARHELGLCADGRPVLQVMRSALPITAWLLLAALIGGYGAGIGLGLLGAFTAGRPTDWLTGAACVLVIALPTATWSALLGSPQPQLLAAMGVMALTSAALVSRFQRAASRSLLDQEHIRTAKAFGASPARLAARSFRGSSAAVMSLLGVDLPLLLLTAFVVERGFGLNGLGAVTVNAVAAHDVAWLMAMVLVSTASVALVQIASDVGLARLDPRVDAELARKRGSTA